MLKNKMTNEVYFALTIGLGTILFVGGMALIVFVIRGKCEQYNEDGTCTKRSSNPMSTTKGSIAYIFGMIMAISGVLLLISPIGIRLYHEIFGED